MKKIFRKKKTKVKGIHYNVKKKKKRNSPKNRLYVLNAKN